MPSSAEDVKKKSAPLQFSTGKGADDALQRLMQNSSAAKSKEKEHTSNSTAKDQYLQNGMSSSSSKNTSNNGNGVLDVHSSKTMSKSGSNQALLLRSGNLTAA